MAAARATQRIARQNLHIISKQPRHSFTSRTAESSAPCFAHHPTSHIQAQKEQQNPTYNQIRQFHSSRHLLAAGDDSTIDFAYLPSSAAEEEEDVMLRVPIIPDNYSTTENAPPEIPAAVMKPEISTMSADAVFLPMADLSDGHAMNIDFHAMADRVAANPKNVKDVAPEEQASLIKQIWNDLVDDMIGAKRKK